MITVELDDAAIQQLVIKIQGLIDATDVDAILDEAEAFVLNKQRTRFMLTEDPEGNKWIESAAAVKRRSSGRDGDTLYDQGKLFHSIQAAVTGANERFVGTDLFYGLFHQYGTKVLPKRVFIGVSDEDTETLAKLLNLRYEDAIS